MDNPVGELRDERGNMELKTHYARARIDFGQIRTIELRISARIRQIDKMPISSLRCAVTQNYAGLRSVAKCSIRVRRPDLPRQSGLRSFSSAQSSFWARPGRRRRTFASPLPIHISSPGNSYSRTAAKTPASSPFGAPFDLAHCYHQGTFRPIVSSRD